MTGHAYSVFDVFTDQALAGNPLGVVYDCEDLDTAAMQRIANEFNLSETVFLSSPDRAEHSARVRIFTPFYEMPFAGHPTVGSAVALALRDGIADGIFVLEENIGPVRCVVSTHDGRTFAEFDMPKLPAPAPFDISREAAAAALGLGPHEIGFENHTVSAWNAGVPYVTVPIADLSVASRAKLDTEQWLTLTGGLTDARAPAAYIYCRDTVLHDSAFHARMFAGHIGLVEDPATGSAAAAFAGAVMHFDRPVDGKTQLWIEQGMEMGRPSRIRLELDVEAGSLRSARIGGNAVKVAEGRLAV
ncbi:MAG TPA: PhzF family phenazine biosynthesis protein [Rhizobiaceae bacterium]|nr:PhzF family phenazine biosynthesis protein [Rhizobiaceae bacterium]